MKSPNRCLSVGDRELTSYLFATAIHVRKAPISLWEAGQ